MYDNGGMCREDWLRGLEVDECTPATKAAPRPICLAKHPCNASLHLVRTVVAVYVCICEGVLGAPAGQVIGYPDSLLCTVARAAVPSLLSTPLIGRRPT